MRKAFDIVKTILVWLVVLGAVTMTVFTVFSLTTLNRNDRTLFGYKIFIVNSDSMEKTDFKSGDLIFVKAVDLDTLKPGDIITFISKDENSLDETLTHKIRSLATDANGNKGFITYGTSTNADDAGIVLYQDILGKYEFHIAGLGAVFNFLKTTQGFFLCIFTPIMLVVLYEIINFFVVLRKSKKEALKEMEAERASNDQLVEELRILKAQLEEKQLALNRQNQVLMPNRSKTKIVLYNKKCHRVKVSKKPQHKTQKEIVYIRKKL
ncbi:MAG: signal peptidase I [Clostridia bacterium]|nr:signal peptidase I [Clostridia bacterium]